MAPSSTICDPGCHPPKTVSHALAESLTRRGIKVHLPYGEDSDYLKVTGARGASCDLTIDDDDSGMTQHLNLDPQHSQPGQVAAMVAGILGADYTNPGQYAHLHKGVTLAGAVGRDMQIRGFNVNLKVFEDREEFRVTADVVITNPAQPQRGEVSISDDGWLAWDCYANEFPGGLADLADTITATLTGISHETES